MNLVTKDISLFAPAKHKPNDCHQTDVGAVATKNFLSPMESFDPMSIVGINFFPNCVHKRIKTVFDLVDGSTVTVLFDITPHRGGPVLDTRNPPSWLAGSKEWATEVTEGFQRQGKLPTQAQTLTECELAALFYRLDQLDLNNDIFRTIRKYLTTLGFPSICLPKYP